MLCSKLYSVIIIIITHLSVFQQLPFPMEPSHQPYFLTCIFLILEKECNPSLPFRVAYFSALYVNTLSRLGIHSLRFGYKLSP